MHKFCLLTAATALVFSAGAAPANAAVAKLLTDAAVYSAPGQTGKPSSTIKAVRPLTGSPTTLPVIASAETDTGRWVRVRLPQRPNGSTGWIAAGAAQIKSNPWTITVSRKARMVTVKRSRRTVRRFRVVVGKASTPTPAGTFFVAEVVRQPTGTASGPWALATSAYSNVLQEFDGGPGQIALHGRTGLTDPLGSAASHGCIRFSDKAISWMAGHIPAGTVVRVR